MNKSDNFVNPNKRLNFSKDPNGAFAHAVSGDYWFETGIYELDSVVRERLKHAEVSNSKSISIHKGEGFLPKDPGTWYSVAYQLRNSLEGRGVSKNGTPNKIARFSFIRVCVDGLNISVPHTPLEIEEVPEVKLTREELYQFKLQQEQARKERRRSKKRKAKTLKLHKKLVKTARKQGLQNNTHMEEN